MITCPNKKSKFFKDLVKVQGENISYSLWNEYEGNVPERFYNESVNKPEVQYQKQTASDEGIIATEKTIRDLAARMSDRLGMKYKIISPTVKWNRVQYTKKYLFYISIWMIFMPVPSC